MVKKTYKTFFLKSLDMRLVSASGKKVEVVFAGGARFDSTARYTTTDAETQTALEASSGFGRDYYLERTVNADEPEGVVVASSPEPKKELATVIDSRRFQNLVEMKSAMTEVGIEVDPQWNYAKCVSVSTKAGYDFQISRK